MDALIILDSTKTPNEIITVQSRAGEIKVVSNPANCLMVVQYIPNSIDTIISVDEPILNQSINTSDISKWYFHYGVNILRAIWQSEGVDVSLIDDYIANTNLGQYENPRRGYLIAETELLKPFLISNGVDISKIEDFEELNA